MTLNKTSTDLDWTMAKEYYEILAAHKRSYYQFRIVKDAEGLLSNIIAEIVFVESYISLDNPESSMETIEDLLLKAEKLIYARVVKGRLGQDTSFNNNSEAIRLIDKAQKLLNRLEASAGMLQPKPTGLHQKLRKFGD